MPARRLPTRIVEKPWGRRDLGPWFPDVPADAPPVGEIWFEDAPDAALMVKFLFTAERLSIQVHPDDAAARAAGHPRGKDEAWLVLAADAGAHIGLGLTRPASGAELRAAALDGSIEALLDWKPAAAGDAWYSPAGTIHALGPGLKLVEVQQNIDLTYRLYDYGRPRELHLEEGLAVARGEPFAGAPQPPQPLGDGRARVAWGPAFHVERWTGPVAGAIEGPAWVTLLAGAARLDGARAQAGECWRVDGAVAVTVDRAGDLLVARAA
jgi:mannose-6-phosphate isomerase